MVITAVTVQLAVSIGPEHITHPFVVVKQFGFPFLLGHHHYFLNRVHAVHCTGFQATFLIPSCGACGKVEVVTVGQLMSEELRPII